MPPNFSPSNNYSVCILVWIPSKAKPGEKIQVQVVCLGSDPRTQSVSLQAKEGVSVCGLPLRAIVPLSRWDLLKYCTSHPQIVPQWNIDPPTRISHCLKVTFETFLNSPELLACLVHRQGRSWSERTSSGTKTLMLQEKVLIVVRNHSAKLQVTFERVGEIDTAPTVVPAAVRA